MDTADVLASSALFRGVARERCERFVPIARERHVCEGHDLFRLGQDAGALFVVRRGVVQLTTLITMNGSDHDLMVDEAHPGDMVAWSALIEPYRFTMSARARTDVDLLGFARRELQAALEAEPDVGLRVITNLAAVIGRRLHVMQTMWNRELQRTVSETFG